MRLPRFPRIARGAGFGLSLALLSSAGQTFFIGLFGAELRAALQLDEAQLGGLYAAATVCSGVLMFWLGAKVDERPAHHVVGVVLALLGAGAALMALASTPAALLLALFLLRLGGQGLAGHLAIVAAARAGGRRGRNIALAAFGFILGEASLPLAVVWWLDGADWRSAWWCIVVLLALAAPLLLHRARRMPATPAGPAAPSGPVRAGRVALLRSGAFHAGLSVVLVPPFVVTAVFLHQGTLAELRGWGPPAVAAGFAAFAGAQFSSTWLAGRAVDRYGSRALLRFYLMPLAAGCLALALLPPGPALWCLFIGLGLSAGANSVVGASLWADLFGIARLGLVRGVYLAIMVLVTAVSPLLLGHALQAGIGIGSLAISVACYALSGPWLASRWLMRQAPAPADG